MNEKSNNHGNEIKYTLLSGISFIVSLIGFLGVKILIVAVGVSFAILSEKYIGKFGLTIGWFLGLAIGGLLFSILQRYYPYLERLDKKAREYKPTPFTDRFGLDFPKPTPDNFNITQQEFKEYNNRFQFEYIKLILTYGIVIIASCYLINSKIKGIEGFIIMGSAVILAIFIGSLLSYLNAKFSQRNPHYKKINAYQEALRTYYKIRDENSKF